MIIDRPVRRKHDSLTPPTRGIESIDGSGGGNMRVISWSEKRKPVRTLKIGEGLEMQECIEVYLHVYANSAEGPYEIDIIFQERGRAFQTADFTFEDEIDLDILEGVGIDLYSYGRRDTSSTESAVHLWTNAIEQLVAEESQIEIASAETGELEITLIFREFRSSIRVKWEQVAGLGAKSEHVADIFKRKDV